MDNEFSWISRKHISMILTKKYSFTILARKYSFSRKLRFYDFDGKHNFCSFEPSIIFTNESTFENSRRVDLCSAISSLMPNFCTVYVVSKGKLSSVRAGYLDANATLTDDSSGKIDSSSSSSRPISGP